MKTEIAISFWSFHHPIGSGRFALWATLPCDDEWRFKLGSGEESALARTPGLDALIVGVALAGEPRPLLDYLAESDMVGHQFRAAVLEAARRLAGDATPAGGSGSEVIDE